VLKNRPYDVVNGVPLTRFDGVANAKLYLVHLQHEWDAVFPLLMQQKLVAFDTETQGFEYFKGDRIVGFSFGWSDTHFYAPVRHEPSVLGGDPPPQLCLESIKPDLTSFFAQTDVFTIFHNFKFDCHFLAADGIEVHTPTHDTRILWQLFNENAPGKLKTIASGWKDDLGRWAPGVVDPEAAVKEKELDTWRVEEAKARRAEFRATLMAKADELETAIEFQAHTRAMLKQHIKEKILSGHPYIEAKKSDIHYGFIPIELMCEYAGVDTFLTYRIYSYLMENIEFTPDLRKLYINEIKLSRVLLSMEEAGVKVDRGYLQELGDRFQLDIGNLERQIKEYLGIDNVNSNDQLAKALTRRGIELTAKTSSGKFAVDKKVLTKLAKKHDVVKDILQLRKLNKLRNTYVESIRDKLTDGDILHCSFNQNVATGRMSSASPNLQNIPGRDDSIRRSFVIPNDDYVFLFADYSQVEVRLTAHYSSDALLLDAYKKEQDIHTRTMCEMFSHSYDESRAILKQPDHPKFKGLKHLRNVAKIVNFSIIYGSGAPGLASQIARPARYENVSDKRWISVCQDYIDSYLAKYLGVKRFINRTKREIRKDGQLTNHFGRVRHLPHINATKILKDRTKFWMEARAERQGVNFLIQGTCADIFKIATVRVFDLLKGKKSYIVNVVHDELQVYLHKSEFDLLREIKTQMEDFDFLVPIVADFEVSFTNWADKREI
jgi:DNA polymerase I-like protein with 3'-5' exonuclease and polymerase domains